MNSFLLALQFLTIIPVTHALTVNDKELGLSSLFYPLIGLLIGCLLAISALLISHVSLQIQAIILLIIWVIITGGLHLDGLADCADAWIGGFGSKQRSLDIMKDSAAGPVAVIVLVLVLLLKYSIIYDLLEQQTFEVIVLTAMLGRLAILIQMITTDYIRKTGLGEKIVANLPEFSVIAISLSGLILGVYFLGFLPICFMLLTLLFINQQAKKRLGGVTGDVYGATVELVEVSVLLGVVI